MLFKPFKTLFIPLLLLALLTSFFHAPAPARAAALSRPPNNLGLVGYWGFDEGVGTKAGDRSGNGNTGTLSGATWADGKLGKALSFNGAGNLINYGDVPSLELSENFTISAWVNPNPGPWHGAIVNKNTLNGYLFRLQSYAGSNFYISFSTAGVWERVSSAVLVQPNIWSHVVVTGTFGGSASIYLNGSSVATNTIGTPTYSTENFTIGSITSYHFNGLIDDVRIYNRALGASEIAALYRAGGITGKQSSKQGLVGYWPLNEGRGSKAGDFSGSGNTGTLSGATWTDGRRGKALSFNGSNNYVYTNNIAGLPTSQQARSVSFWVYQRSRTNGVSNAIVDVLRNVSGQSFTVALGLIGATNCINSGTSPNVFLFTDSINSSNNICLQGDQIPSLNTWNHITLTFDGGSAFVYYLNGASKLNGNFGTTINTNTSGTVEIGRRSSAVSGYFDGLIDDVRIYNRALTAAEVRTLFGEGETQINSSQNKLNGTLDTGLVGLWSFNGQDYNSASTTAEVLDRSGNNNHGDNIGATRTIGKVGQALKFDGVDDYVSVPDSPSLDVNSITVSAWVKGTIGSGLRVIALRYIPTICWDLTASNGALVWYVGTGSGSWDLVSALGTKYINDNKWHHVVGVYNGTVGSVYVDGNFDVSGGSAGSMCTGTSPITIGAYSDSLQNLNGSIDEIRVYSRALSADEIKQLYNAGK